jgi:Raf kinase inhibitor-like YbhB/YbcL family protein
MIRTLLMVSGVLMLLAGCPGGTTTMKLDVTSPAFREGETIPQKYTGDGADVSPPLQWSGAPESTKSFAVICDDPDAPRGTWVHWVLYNVPAATTSLPEGVPATAELDGGGKQGKNDFGKLGYGGPAPPKGKPHRYFFKVYALDTTLNLAPGATKADLVSAMKRHVVAEGQLMGKYAR